MSLPVGFPHAHLYRHGRESFSVAAAEITDRGGHNNGPQHTNRRAPFLCPGFVFSTDEGDHFVGGSVNTAPQVYVHGLIRQGRNTEVKQALMSQMLEEIPRIAGLTVEDIWIYLQDIPATQMIEFGRFLPAPGGEAEWEREMTPEKRSRLPK